MTSIFASLLLAASLDPNSAAVFQAEVALNNAVAAHDVKTIASMITNDYTLGFSNGKLYDRDTFLKAVADPALVVTENRARDEAVRFLRRRCSGRHGHSCDEGLVPRPSGIVHRAVYRRLVPARVTRGNRLRDRRQKASD